MSTTLSIGRIPAATSRPCSHAGEGPIRTFRRSAAANRGHASGSSMRTSRPFGVRVVRGSSAASRRAVARSAATSRATPTIPRQSGRFGCTSSARIASPRTSRRSAPTGSFGSRSWIPSWSSPRPSSFAERTMPSLLMPRIGLPRRVVRSPVWPSMISAPSSANGTIAPTERFAAPVTTVFRRPSRAAACPRSDASRASRRGRRARCRPTTGARPP